MHSDTESTGAFADLLCILAGFAAAQHHGDDRKMPTNSAQQEALAQKVSVTGEFFLRDRGGNQIADPIVVTSLGAPRPAGS